MGTAGHVDHGKTLLTKALTDIDCDTHPEEKRRGITMNLGFAHLKLDTGDTVGIIDVPGHRDFIQTMIAGAIGIDFVLLVVAADSGVMPQTVEHVQIMQSLGIKAGIVALTKIDAADETVAELAQQDVEELLDGTFLQGAPIIKVSATTGQGLPQLRAELERIAAAASPRRGGGVVRMFIDRIFSVVGFGTVVTGSVLGGELTTEDSVHLLPSEKTLRVRRIERYGEPVDQICAGDRASLNLVGLKRADFKRGMIVSDRMIRSTVLVDARIELFAHDRTLDIWTQVVFILGTFTTQAKVHLLSCNSVKGGASALVQIHLSEPGAIVHGDRFVIRGSSNNLTLGGGVILDSHPNRHKRRPAALIQRLQALAEGGLDARIIAEVAKSPIAVSAEALTDSLAVSTDEIVSAVDQQPDVFVVHQSANGSRILQLAEQNQKFLDQICAHLAEYHRQHPFDVRGQDFDALTGMCGKDRTAATDVVLASGLDSLVDTGKLQKIEGTFTLAGHSVTLSPKQKAQIEFFARALQDAQMSVPSMSAIMARAKKLHNINERQSKQILGLLVRRGEAVQIEDRYLHNAIVEHCRTRLSTHLSKPGAGVTVGEFRDLVSGNRKFALLILGYFDQEGLTVRRGDTRHLVSALSQPDTDDAVAGTGSG